MRQREREKSRSISITFYIFIVSSFSSFLLPHRSITAWRGISCRFQLSLSVFLSLYDVNEIYSMPSGRLKAFKCCFHWGRFPSPSLPLVSSITQAYYAHFSLHLSYCTAVWEASKRLQNEVEQCRRKRREKEMDVRLFLRPCWEEKEEKRPKQVVGWLACCKQSAAHCKFKFKEKKEETVEHDRNASPGK